MPGRQLVVGAAVVAGGRVLAARRSYPPAARGGWELPGGKVEPGESPQDAVVRELREELGLTVRVTAMLPGEQPVGTGLVLRVLLAVPVAGEPTPREHDALRWLGPVELDDVAWLPADRPFLEDLRAVLLEGRREDQVGGRP